MGRMAENRECQKSATKVHESSYNTTRRKRETLFENGPHGRKLRKSMENKCAKLLELLLEN